MTDLVLRNYNNASGGSSVYTQFHGKWVHICVINKDSNEE